MNGTARKVAPPQPCVPRCVFRLGGYYIMQLVHEPGRHSAFLFDRNYLHDGDEHGFCIAGKTYQVTEHVDGTTTRTDEEWVVEPNRLHGTWLTDPTFELNPDDCDTIEVSCGLGSCNEMHTITCQMRECTREEAEAVNAARIERKRQERAQKEQRAQKGT